MTKLIWMSDLHFALVDDLLNHDPHVRLAAAIDHINEHHADAQMCIISGDMVNRETLEDYVGVRASLDALTVPYFPMVGNHDDRNLFKRALPLPGDCMVDFVQYKVRTRDGVMVCLDTKKEGSDAGELCQARLDWLQETLEQAEGLPVFLFMHHPPMPLGLPMQDADNLENGQDLIDLISNFDCVKYLFLGHVHRPITGVVGGIPFSTMRSVLYQAPAPRPDWTWDTFKPSEEAPNIGVIQFDGASVVLQYEQFCEFKMGVVRGR